VILRKAFGLAFFAMFSPDHGGDVVLAWPDARIGFMDPVTAANVLYGDELADVPAPERRAQLAKQAEALGASSSARDVAAAMGIDEIIHERETVDAIRRALDVLAP
jgi:acetyl-CoA carboxylase carboxyltransferase component